MKKWIWVLMALAAILSGCSNGQKEEMYSLEEYNETFSQDND